MSGKYLDLNGTDEYSFRNNPSNLDMNGSERILASANCDFETSFDWAGNGNHSLAQSNEDIKAGTYSGKIAASAAGDLTANFISLAQDKFTQLVAGEKYTFEMWVRGIGIVTPTELVVGGDCEVAIPYINFSTIGSNVTIGLSTEQAYSGTHSTKIISTSATSNLHRAISFRDNTNLKIENGKLYKISGWFYYPTGQTGSPIILYSFNNSGSWASAVSQSDSWQYREGYAVGSVAVAAMYMSIYSSAAVGTYWYLDDFSIKEVTQPSITIGIGNQSKTINNISCVPGVFTKCVINFQATADEVDWPIKLYFNQADSVYIDSVSLTQAYDMLINMWLKPSSFISLSTFLSLGTATTGYFLRTTLTGLIESYIVSDGFPSAPRTVTDGLSISEWKLLTVVINRTSDVNFYLNGVLATKDSQGTINITAVGKIILPYGYGLYISTRYGADRYFPGQVGEIQITRFADIVPSNYRAGEINNVYTGGGATVVLHHRWLGSTIVDALTDLSASGNNLTGVNLTFDEDVGTTNDYSHYEFLASTVKTSGSTAAVLRSLASLQATVKTSSSTSAYLRSLATIESIINTTAKTEGNMRALATLQSEIKTAAKIKGAIRRKTEFDLLIAKFTETL